MKTKIKYIGALVFSAFSVFNINAQETEQYKQFVNPPSESRPRVWWHWMDGNITKDGIYKDIMWMNRVGIGGFHHFDAGMYTAPVVDKRLIYMDSGWKDAFRYATHLADSLGMEMAVASAPGWSSTGGPWVKPENAMKKLTWREVIVKGGAKVSVKLPEAFQTTGFFQNIPPSDNASTYSSSSVDARYYKDIAVLAVRLNKAEKNLTEMNVRISSSGGQFTLEQLTDGDLANSILLPPDEKYGYAWIQYEFNNPQTIKALSVVDGKVRNEWACAPASVSKHLEGSNDGKVFRKICDIPDGGTFRQTMDIPVTTARFFRVTFDNPEANNPLTELTGAKTNSATPISELVLYPVSKINHAEEKAGFATPHDMMENITPEESDISGYKDVVDLTDKVDVQGNLTWNAPEGDWKIYRFGYSLTGKKNHPAPPEATGLEVDKLDADAVKDYMETYLKMYQAASGGLMGKKGLQYLLIDSYEAGWSTWTAMMQEEFERRRGYSLLKWLPVLTGQIIESTEKSEQFLWDWRKTIGELIAENLYGQVEKVVKQHEMDCYFESHENGRMYLVDGMEAKKKAKVPMAAIWALDHNVGANHKMSECDFRESASVAHIYGQNLVAGESFTISGLDNQAYSFYPERLKPVADLALACGLNRFVIHESAHQPVDDKKPGLGLLIFGQWFNRHETWAEQAKAWTDYLARSSYMLQQGKYVADVLYFYGEDNCITGLFAHKLPEIPTTYSFDYVNADALLSMISFDGKNLVTPTGMKYRLLVLDNNARKMSLPVLKKIAELVKQGAVVSGQKPEYEPSLIGNKVEFQRIVNEIWNSQRKNVLTGKPVKEALKAIHVTPDFSSDNMDSLRFVHRTTPNSEIYWVNNRTNKARNVEAKFRVTGLQPQLWHPETGETEPVSYSIEKGHTKVLLHLQPNDAVFVVFGSPTDVTQNKLPEKVEKEILSVNGPWKVDFQAGRGAPVQALYKDLASFTENTNSGIKYFSGTAGYTTTIDVSANFISSNSRFYLDLGVVKNIAEVTINGKSIGTLWKTPFKVEVTQALKSGENKLEIKVTNLWVNRLIGDMQPDVKQKITYTSYPFFKADSPLLPSGLLGPVRIISVGN